MNPSPTLLRAFRQPLVITSILVLLLNDHFLKAKMPSALTGKLSDFAGLFFFPFLLGVLIQVVQAAAQGRNRRTAQPLPARRALLLGFYLCAVVFAAIKTLPGVNAWAVDGLTQLFGLPVRIALDPTDLAALVVFYPAWKLWRRVETREIEARPTPQPPGKTAYLALALGSLAALATAPCPFTPGVARLAVDETVLYASQSPWGSNGANPVVLHSEDGGLTWALLENPPAALVERLEPAAQLPLTACEPGNPQLCYRIDGRPQVEESRDGGQTWRVAWQVPPERMSFMQRAANPQMIMACGKNPDYKTFDLVLLPGPAGVSIVTAMGNEGLVARRPDGSWERLSTRIPGVTWDAFPATLAAPTPFRAGSLGQFLVTTQTEMWTLLGLGLLVYLGLTGWAWYSVARRAAQPPTRGSWALAITLLVIAILIAVLIAVPYLVRFQDGIATLGWLGSLLLLAPTTLILSLFVWNRAGRLAGRPAPGWLAFGLGWLWFALVYAVFGLWAFGVIPAYETTRAASVVVGLLALGGAVYLLNQRLLRRA